MSEPTGIPGGMETRTQILIIVIGLSMLGIVLNMVRRRELREQYSLLWLFSAVVLVLTAVFTRQIDDLAVWLGIHYPPAFLFLVAILLVLLMQFHFSAVISSLREQNRSLTQSHGVLAAEVRRLGRELRDRHAQDGGGDRSGDRPDRNASAP